MRADSDSSATATAIPTTIDSLKANAFREAGNRDVTVHVYPGCEPYYDCRRQPMVVLAALTRSAVEPAVMGMIVDWLVERLKRSAEVQQRATAPW